MAAVADASVVATELEKLIPKVRVAFEFDGNFFADIEKQDVQKVSNRQMRIPLELRPGGSFQYFNADGGDLGRGGGPFFDKAVLNCVFMSENIEYTKLAQWGTDDARKAVINGVRRLTADALKEIRRQLDAQMMQDGSGVIGTISSVSTAGGVDTYTLTSTFGARLMRYGQTIQVYNAAMDTKRGSGTISMWDVENKQISVPAIAGAAATDVIVTDGITDPTASQGLFGVPYHHSNSSTGTWLGFNRATTPEIRSNRVNGNANSLSLPLPRLAVNKIGNRVGIDNDFAPVARLHPCQKQAYEQIGQLVSVVYKDPKEQALDMYFDKMQMAGAPVKQSYNWAKDRIDFVAKSVWGRGEILPIGFYKTDGRSIFEIRGASGGVATADIFYMVIGTQAFVNNPAATAYIDNLAIPNGY